MTSSMNKMTMIAALAIAPMLTGCATKRFVRTTVTPIEQKVGDLEAGAKAQARSIEELDRGVARADERARGAQGKADSAAEEAALARGEAAEGRTLAMKGLTRSDELEKSLRTVDAALEARLESMQKYQLTATDEVVFGSGKWEVDAKAALRLDAAAGQVRGRENFVIEVRGFTDSTGTKQMNLELSRKRADAVVRYLTAKHGVPLHRIYVAGYGQESGLGDNRTRDGRQRNRRVELKVFVTGEAAAQRAAL
jgi:OOP family OmpA-OmpF porin